MRKQEVQVLTQKSDSFSYIVLSLETKDRMRHSQRDQSPVIIINVVVGSLVLPADHIDVIGSVIAVMVAALGPQELLT